MADYSLAEETMLTPVQRFRTAVALGCARSRITLPHADARAVLEEIGRQTPVYHVHLPPEPGNLAVRFQAACLVGVLYGELGDLALQILRWLQ